MNIAPGGKQWIFSVFIIFLLFLLSTFLFQDFYLVMRIAITGIIFVLFVLLIIFFRDPERQIGRDITAVADGVIQAISTLSDEKNQWIRISTFMNIHNVHVNRMPLEGEILKIVHYPGGYLPAFKKESDRNERLELIAKTIVGNIKIMLIAGPLARRIVPYVKVGDRIKKGDRISLIRLGSRVDIYLPESKVNIRVNVSDRIRAGVDTIASINA